MSVAELFAPEPGVATHPAVAAASFLAADLLEPHAAQADLPGGVRRDHLEVLAAAGLSGVALPAEHGGLGAPVAVDREVQELLGGACGATWFVLAQHRLPAVLATQTDCAAARDRWLRPLCTGQVLGGTAFTHLRRPGAPQVTVRRDGDGWVLDGVVDWCSGWGLLDVFAVGGQTDEGRVVFALLPADRSGVTASSLDLSVMAGTHTAALTFDGVAVGADEVVLEVDRQEWLAADAARTSNATPGNLGLLRRVLVELEQTGYARGGTDAVAAAEALAAEAVPLRRHVYELLDDVPAAERVDERQELRAAVGDLTVRATAALVAAQAGRAVLRTSPAQRWAREALFHLIQAQTVPVRAATLRLVAARSAADPGTRPARTRG